MLIKYTNKVFTPNSNLHVNDLKTSMVLPSICDIFL